MSITVTFAGTTARIILSGDIDYSTQEKNLKEYSKVLNVRNIKQVQVDLAKVTFLDSSGIRALLSLQAKAGKKGISMLLLNCNSSIREIFEIGGFDKMFTIQ